MGKLMLTDDLFHLNDPASVDNLLAHNPGRFVLVVIDSLFRCVSGSLSQDVVASAAMDAIERISRATGAAMAAIHHEPRSGEHLFGSVMLDAAYDAKIHVERGKDRNSVIVTVQELKNAPIPDKPFTYRIEEEYLAAVTGAASATTPKLASSRHQEMFALLPAGWFTRKEGRKLVEPLLTGTEEARRKQWQRAVAAMKASGEIEVRATRHEEDVTTAPHPLWRSRDPWSPVSPHCLSHVLLFVRTPCDGVKTRNMGHLKSFLSRSSRFCPAFRIDQSFQWALHNRDIVSQISPLNPISDGAFAVNSGRSRHLD